MNKQTEKNLYFIDTSLPGDEGYEGSFNRNIY